MLTADEIYARAAGRGARPDPVLSIAEWADRYRTLSQRAAAEPGPWRTDRTPYLREIMDCLARQRIPGWNSRHDRGEQCGRPSVHGRPLLVLR